MSDIRIPYCGECCFLNYEDIDGYGICNVNRRECRCSDRCRLDHTTMRPKEIAKGLHYIQKWRRGAKVPMPSPYVIGKVNDAAIYQLRKLK